jgi:hypothetical protein
MSRPSSTALTLLPGISSVGRFEIDCETPYNLSPWPDDPGDDEWMVHVESIPGQVFTFHGDELRAPGFGSIEDRVAFALRRVCHFLIDQIDDKGLEEVCRSLGEFYAYYRPTEHTPQLLQVRTKPAIECYRSTSPAFLIGEE